MDDGVEVLGTSAPPARALTGSATASDLRAYLPDVQARWLGEQPERTSWSLDATLVFADVSGFTPLTERLARRGKVGAEELTDVLNEVFDALLGVAASYGGDLLKFGGDALLLLFSGEDHAARGCRAAWEMQLAIRPYRRFTTGAGRISLRMSVGVSSGEVVLFLVGDSHRELLVGGPVVSSTVAMEQAAEADEILVAPGTATRLGPLCLGATRGEGTRLARAPDVASWAPAADGRAPDDADAGIPVMLRPYLGASGDGEHRQAVLTFIQFGGLDELLTVEGPAVAAAALDELVGCVQDACDTYGVCFLASDVDGDGGKILLVAGVPNASTDDDDRTLLALRQVVETPHRLRVRAGVNRGPAFAVDVGSASRRTFAVMGDATNLAARVMGKAEPGQIVATESVWEHVRAPFASTALEPFVVKGKSTPVTARVVGAPDLSPSSAATATGPLIGRDTEIAILQGLVRDARAGSGGLVQLTGEAGIGKSTLVSVLTQERLPTLRFDGLPYAAASPYVGVRRGLLELLGTDARATDRAVAEALERAVHDRARELEAWTSLLAVAYGLELPPSPEVHQLDPAFRRSKLHRLVRTLVARLLPGPALILVEDAHWLDDASSGLLHGLLRDAPRNGWAVCTTRRDVEGGLRVDDLPGATVLGLSPLDEDAARQVLVNATADRPLAPYAIDALVERAGGNPLFLSELASAARDGEDLTTLPATVEAVIATRIDTLPPADRLLLRKAAVLGTRFSVELLDAMLEDGADIRERLGQLGHFVVSDGHHARFTHALLRDVAYESLPFKQRRRLHGRAGDLLLDRAGDDADERADLLSLHYAVALRYPETWRFARIAGDRAQRNGAPVEAATFLERALDAARHLAGQVDERELITVYAQLGDVAELSGQYELAASSYREARRRCREPDLTLADLYKREGWLRERAAHTTQALRWYTRAAGLLDTLPPCHRAEQLRAELDVAYGAVRLRQGRHSDAVPRLERAVERARRGSKRTLGHAYYLLDWAHTDLGDPRAAWYRDEALRILEEVGDQAMLANLLNNLGVDAYYEGRWEQAIVLYERSGEARARAGDVVQSGTAYNNIAEIRSDQGRYAEAEALFEEALRIWASAPWPFGVAIANSNLGRAAARAGSFDRAREHFAEAERCAREVGAEGLANEILARALEACVLHGDGPAVTERMDHLRAQVARIGDTPTLVALLERLSGYAAAQAGDLVQARQHLETAVATAATAHADYEVALSLEGLAATQRSVDPTASARWHAEAQERFGRLGVTATPTFRLAAGR